MRTLRVSLVGVAVLALLAGANTSAMAQDDPQNPIQDSVATAHGNTDWHIDTAEEFLFGTDMNGNPTAANHAPASWTRTHMHVGLTNTDHFYYDEDLITPGDDNDATSGIDNPMLFFYAGHGCPHTMYWDTLGNTATQCRMELGDSADDGLLRYYWQCSCNIFAHGPRTGCPGTAEWYACPGDFDGSADSFSMRDVYERWGPVLAPDLRMACGVSTRAYCHEWQTNAIWDNYLNDGLDVADSWIEGTRGTPWPVPLCITTGESAVWTTPLFDQTFTNQPNDSGPWLHIQYPDEFASNEPPVIWQIEPPDLLTIPELIPGPWPDPILDMELREWEGILATSEEVQDRGPRVRVDPVSGAIYVRGSRADYDATTLSEREYLARAEAIIRELGWTEQESVAPLGSTMQLLSTPAENPGEEVVRAQKNATVRVRRVVPFEDLRIPVFGEGGAMTIQMNNDGSLLNASKVWRTIEDEGALAPVKPYGQALEEALAELREPSAYELDRWYWGYKEAAGNVEQDRLLIHYWFEFTPESEELVREFPPQLVEILGHMP